MLQIGAAMLHAGKEGTAAGLSGLTTEHIVEAADVSVPRIVGKIVSRDMSAADRFKHHARRWIAHSHTALAAESVLKLENDACFFRTRVCPQVCPAFAGMIELRKVCQFVSHTSAQHARRTTGASKVDS